MEEIPFEFQPYSSFIIAAENVKKYNPIASHVLTQVFVDICQDIITTTNNPTAIEFLKNLNENLPEFPRDGPDETKLLADDLYDSLCNSLRAGKISTRTSQEFWLCGILYSVLAGDEAIKRERICRLTAARLKRALFKTKKAATAPPQGTSAPPPPATVVPGTNLRKIYKANDQKKDEQQNKTNPSKKQPQTNNNKPAATNAPPPNLTSISNQPLQPVEAQPPPITYESVISNYDENRAILYLNSLGVKMPTVLPKLNEKMKPNISRNLDLGLSCMEKDDFAQAKSFLMSAQKCWKNGRPF